MGRKEKKYFDKIELLFCFLSCLYLTSGCSNNNQVVLTSELNFEKILERNDLLSRNDIIFMEDYLIPEFLVVFVSDREAYASKASVNDNILSFENTVAGGNYAIGLYVTKLTSDESFVKYVSGSSNLLLVSYLGSYRISKNVTMQIDDLGTDNNILGGVSFFNATTGLGLTLRSVDSKFEDVNENNIPDVLEDSPSWNVILGEDIIPSVLEGQFNALYYNGGDINYYKWNYYVNQTDSLTSCAGESEEECIHAGPKRVFEIPESFILENTTYQSCEELSLRDNLNTFDWECIYENGYFRFISTLKDGIKLSDLIDISDSGEVSFKEISVILNDKYISPTNILWSDDFYLLKDDTVDSATDLVKSDNLQLELDDDYSIYVVDGSGQVTTSGLYIKEEGISVVVMPSVSLLYVGDIGYLDDIKGVIVSFNNFSWIEGEVDGSFNAHYGVYGDEIKFSNFINVAASACLVAGVALSSSQKNILEDIESSENDGSGLILTDSDYNSIINFKAEDNVQTGIVLTNSSYNNFLESLSLSGNATSCNLSWGETNAAGDDGSIAGDNICNTEYSNPDSPVNFTISDN